MKTQHNTLTKTWIVAALASLCCILWGSAIPMIKTGYRLLQVDTADTASQIVFAGSGIVLFFIGKAMGGHLNHITGAGIMVVLYLAFVSAVAYTLWSVLLAYNDVSKVAIFGFVNPLCSVILSALVLGEVKQAFNIGSLIALALVCVGIYIVNAKNTK